MNSLSIFKNKTIASIHIFVMVMMFILVLIITIVFVYEEYDNFDNEAKVIQQKFIQKQKQTIRFDTQRILQFITHMYDKRDKIQDDLQTKKTIINVIEELYGREDGTGYIFIYDYNGVVISDPVQRQNVGKNLYDIEDVNGVKVIKDLIDISRSEDGGYVKYSWLKPTTGRQSPKVSYAKSFEPWGWMVGTGVYLDEIEKVLTEQRDALKIKLNQYVIKILFLLSILFGFGMLGIIVANNILKKEINIFANFFKRAATSHAFIDKKDIGLREFQDMVSYINTMIDIIHTRKQKLKELNVTLESKVEEKTKDLHEKNQLLIEEKNFSHSLVKAQDSFIKHSIHEINTPLAVIITHIDLFKMKEGENHYLSKIEAATIMIANIYNDLGYMIKKDRIDYVKEKIDFSIFLNERVELFKEVAIANGHIINFEIEEDIMIYFNTIELQRVVDNNISNAIKYAKKTTDIFITLSKREDNAILTFMTQSKKIEDTKQIFEAFFQEENLEGGFGLGLEIVGMICKKDDVRIEVDSTDKFTSFIYHFKVSDIS